MRLPPLPAVRDLSRLYGLQAARSLSQNFLFNLELTDRIVRTVPLLGERARRERIAAERREEMRDLPDLLRQQQRRKEQQEGRRRDSEEEGELLVPPVLEVGPGPGALTRSLFRVGAERVAVVERDERFVPALEALQQAVARGESGARREQAQSLQRTADGPRRLKIVRGDILAVAEDSVLLDGGLYTPTAENRHTGVAVVGNLPFAVSTELLLKWIRSAEARTGAFSRELHPFLDDDEVPPVDMVLMFQKEVAERIVAPVGTKEYSRLSVMTQRWFDARIAFHINPRNFVPEPKVWASVVHLSTRSRTKPRKTQKTARATWPVGPHVHTDDVEHVCRELFGFRRTMLRANLRRFGDGAPEAILPALSRSAGLTLEAVGQLRPHNLTVENWCDLTRAWVDWSSNNSAGGTESPERLTDL
jgi:dimethyladenosine transferase 1, mitochondrial